LLENNVREVDSLEETKEGTVSMFAQDSTTYVYNVPDAFEEDSELIRSEMLFFTTPLTQQYSENVYNSLLSIQSQCDVDYSTFCDSQKSSMIVLDFEQLMNSLFSNENSQTLYRRQLSISHAWKKNNGLNLLNSIRSFYLPNLIVGLSSQTKSLFFKKADSLKKIPVNMKPIESNVRTEMKPLEDGVPISFPGGNRPPEVSPVTLPGGIGFAKTKPIKTRLLQMRKTHDMPGQSSGMSQVTTQHIKVDHLMSEDKNKNNSDNSDNEDEQQDHKKHHNKHDREHDEQEEREREEREEREERDRVEDNYFAGALGYGAEGDMCMYQNLPQLSQPCVSSIVDLYNLRDEYWNDYQQQNDYHHRHPPVGLFLFFMLGLLVLSWACRRMRHKKQMKKRLEVQTFFDAILTNPDLKCIVESQTGLQIPVVPIVQKCNAWSCVKKIAYKTLLIVGICVVSVLISISSLEFTAMVVSHASSEVTAPFVLTVLFAVILIQILLFVAFVQSIKLLYLKFSSVHNNNNSNNAPSAPFEQQHTQSFNNNNRNNNNKTKKVWSVGAFPSSLFSFRRFNPEGYSALLTSENNDQDLIGTTTTHHHVDREHNNLSSTSTSGYSAEMVSVGLVAPRWQQPTSSDERFVVVNGNGNNNPQQQGQQYSAVVNVEKMSSVNLV